ncbi:AarF/UbiB family protein [Saccharomonospora xinjiangensis]|uniref:ABC1 kinase family protein n=1 Tax=Saccharomonospora xinjiangensis TaxID=75294 RepID=UPI00106FCF43|nr:AarF/UbiB family protein [Saccharomonospora xinjiangensis]QBQ60201.1 putative protein kinase UbiB [Saccharomonospora xinjiangensis]
MSSMLLGVLSLPLYLLMLWPLVAASRRVLGVPIGTLRAFAGALFGWTIAGLVVSNLPPFSELTDVQRTEPGAAFWLLIPVAGVSFLATLVFLFVAEVAFPSGSGLGPLGRLRSLRRRIGRTRRYSRITAIAVRHGLGPYLAGRRSGHDTDVRQATLARSLRRALEEAGVTFVKLGQVLSTRTDLLPAVFIDELSRLQSQVAPAPQAEIDRVLSAELGRPAHEVFAEFDPAPLAAASIAQVYRARLHSGEEVVVKVQRPDIRDRVERDIDIVNQLARTLHRRAAWARSLGVLDLADGFTAALSEELDFRIEARNADAVAHAAATSGSSGSSTATPMVRIPRAHPEWTTEHVLVMERLDGTPVSQARLPEDEDARRELATALLTCLLRQILDHGTFHADPHPGNILLHDGTTLGLLDFGSVGRLDLGLREGLRSLFVAVDRGDPAALRDSLLIVLDHPDDLDEQRLERALGGLLARHLHSSGGPDAALFADLFRLVADFQLSVPAPIAAVFRALATLEGTLAALAPGFDLVGATREFAAAEIDARLRPTSMKDTVTSELLSVLPLLRRLPRRVDRITNALEQGRLSVNVRLLADSRDRRQISRWLHEVLLAFLGAATGLMAVLLLTGGGGPTVLPDVTLHQLLGYNLLVVSALVGLRLLFLAFRAQHDDLDEP